MKPSTDALNRAWDKVREFLSAQNWNDSNSVILHGMRKSGIADLLHWQDEFRQSPNEIFADFTHQEREDWKLYAVARHGLENYFANGLDFGLLRRAFCQSGWACCSSSLFNTSTR